MVLRPLVRGGSGERRLCSGRRRRCIPCYTAGSKNRSAEKDGSLGGRVIAAVGTAAFNFTYYGVTEQPIAARERDFKQRPE